MTSFIEFVLHEFMIYGSCVFSFMISTQNPFDTKIGRAHV